LVGKCYGGSEEKCGGIYGKQREESEVEINFALPPQLMTLLSLTSRPHLTLHV